MDNFAQNLKFLREKKGLTQAAMQAQIGFSRTTWNNYETGTSYPSFRDLIKIASYFGVSIDDLVTGDVTRGNIVFREPSVSGAKGKVKNKTKELKHAKALADNMIDQLRQDYENAIAERDNLKKQLDFANLTLKSLTDHVETLKDAMKIQMARLEEVQLGKKK